MARDILIRRRRLGTTDRRSLAETLLLWEWSPQSHEAPIWRTSGGFGFPVLVSLGGMFLELLASEVSPDRPLAGWTKDEQTDLARRVAHPRFSQYEAPDPRIDRLVPAMVKHWRDGRFRVLQVDDYRCATSLFVSLREAHAAAAGGPLAASWTPGGLLDYWYLETSAYVNRRGRW